MTPKRNEIPKEHTWDLSPLFSNFKDWESAFEAFKKKFPSFSRFQGQLGTSLSLFKEALEEELQLSRELHHLYTFAHLKHDEDLADDEAKTAYQKLMASYHEFSSLASFFQPELLALPENTLQSYLTSKELAPYSFYLEKIIRYKPHTLSNDLEKLLADSGRVRATPHGTFSALNNADLKFEDATDKEGTAHPLTHGTYSKHLRSPDRSLRKDAFKKVHNKFESLENTFAELLNGQVQNHLFETKARNFPSCLSAALYTHNIPESVYSSLIEATCDMIDGLHKYTALRKKLLGVDELHLYDLYVPLVSEINFQVTFEEAVKLVIESVAPLGKEYQDSLEKGLTQERWVDPFENQGKRSGAYSSGCFDSHPYILMNYHNQLNDAFTLAHEAGHSMHSQLSRKHQPYCYSSYAIFVAEVASTFNEELLMHLLLQKHTEKKLQIYLINQQIEDIRATLFRQTMFAQFERQIHEMAEKNIPLTPKTLKDAYLEMNRFYFGDAVVIDPEIAIEWARIPHFYYNFYVYQYATGISAAYALTDKVLEGDTNARDAYLNFLKGGSSKYPIDLLKGAGVDMTGPEAVRLAIKKFNHLVSQLEELTREEVAVN